MKVSVIGTGYVGLVTGACLADHGNEVWCVDVNEKKINDLNNGIMPIYEPGLEALVERNRANKSLNFLIDIESAVKKSDICFIAVGTPMGDDGSADLHYVLEVARSIGEHMDHHMYVVDKSTVPVGTAKKVRMAIQDVLDDRGSRLTFDVISNPEFLKEGSAIDDCTRPDRIVVGAENAEALSVMRELWLPFVRNNENLISMDIASAEMTKYAANAMLATKISFMNEISNICERVGADVNSVRLGIGSDQRIGYHFIYAGCGYGGSCFPKDVQALIKTSRKHDYIPRILQAVEDVNYDQKLKLSEKIVKKYGEDLSGMTFALWGLSFKPNTDDMREAPSITVIQELTKRGASIKAYDPEATKEAKFYLKDVQNLVYFDSKYDVLNDADALVLVTEWNEFRSPDFREMSKRLKSPVIFDGRNQYSIESMQKLGIAYYQIGVGVQP